MTEFETFKKYCVNAQEMISFMNLNDKNFTSKITKWTNYPLSHNHEYRLSRLNGKDIFSPIDAGIADLIELMNERGYYTKYCCEGHFDEKCDEGYIYFIDELTEEQKMKLILWAVESTGRRCCNNGLIQNSSYFIRVETDNGLTIRFLNKHDGKRHMKE